MSSYDTSTEPASDHGPAPRFVDEVRRSAVLAAPLIVGHVSTGLISFVDAIIAGRHSTQTLAAVSIGTALFWMPLLVPMGTLIALPAAVSQDDGAGRRDLIGPRFRQALWLALFLGLGMWLFMSLIPLALPAMGIAEDIRPGATAFVHGIRWGVPALVMYLCMRYLCDGLHHTVPTMVIGFGGLFLLVPLGYGLTFGAWGLPELGAGGLGYASAAMMWVQMIAAAMYLARAARFRVHTFRPAALGADPGTARHRPADRLHLADGGRLVRRHCPADWPPRRCARSGAPDRGQSLQPLLYGADGAGRSDDRAGWPCGRTR
jgi:multidrug resistance protein, MATE family